MSLIELKGITKRFPGVVALDNVDFDINEGEVLSIIGENGAGKSTLAKIITGVYQPDDGEIFFEDEKISVPDVSFSQSIGINMIHQELNLVPHIDIAGNIFLGREPRKLGFVIDYKRLYDDAEKILGEVGLNVSPKVLNRDIPIAQQQMVEIAKALSMRSKLIIMDEPTSSLTKKEIRVLFDIIKNLRENGISIIYISHRMEEVLEISDRIIALRDGVKVGETENKNVSVDKLIKMMIGRKIDEMFGVHKGTLEETALQVTDLKLNVTSAPASFHLKKGEILGFFGLVGSGRTELMRAVFGIDKRESGIIKINGSDVDIRSPENAIKAGIGFVPEDRKLQGIIHNFTVKENISLPGLKENSKFNLINFKYEKNIASKFIDKLKIKTPSLNTVTANLSGGNQQKVVLSKWLSLSPKILILDEPTRGIDVGAKSEIYNLINQMAADGIAIILVSSEMEEIIRLSHRVAVMFENKITGFLEGDLINQENIMQLSSGFAEMKNKQS
ncbi:sugar ABC transporter ATP-binding protein [candidate division KSB1 bacterium]